MLDWLDLELEQLIRNILRGWLHAIHPYTVSNIPGGYLLGMLSVVPPCVTAKRQGFRT